MAVDVRVEHVELPTYEIGAESPNPWFMERNGAYPYPYRLQNTLTGRRVIRRWEAVVLENEYIRLLLLPEVGCRLFSAYDKLLGREIIYRNDCIRPALIAIRGAWISGGIEWNFPIGHSVYTYSRIPYATKQVSDGSASVIFGLTEQMTGMRWTVEVRLAPGEYRFTDRIRLYNGTEVPHRHYWWTNAALYATPETELIYPMTRCVCGAYGGEVSWPVHDGTDLSRVPGHRFAGDVFAAEVWDDFCGVYHHDLGCGVAHWSPGDELPARKVFLWGQDEMGRLWQSMLTENGGDYLELQAGRFATQSDFDLLQPHELVELSETWIPVAKTDGLVKANAHAVLNVRPAGSGCEIICQSTTSAPNSMIRALRSVPLANGDRPPRRPRGSVRLIGEFPVDLSPGVPVTVAVDQPCENLRVEVLDCKGHVVLAYDPHDRKTVRRVPTASASPGNINGPDPLAQLLEAVHARRAGHHEKAQSHLVAVLGGDPLWRNALWERYFLSCPTVTSGPLASDMEERRIPALRVEAFQEDMDAAAWYLDLGLPDEARAIVKAWINAGPPKDPFLEALISELGVEPPTEFAEDAPGISSCFAHRDTLTRLLQHREDPTSSLHSGNILYAKGQIDEAIESWEKARAALDLGHLPCRNLALAHWHGKHNPRRAYALMREAHEANPRDAETLRDLDVLAELTGNYADREEIARWILEHAPDDSACLERAVRIYLEAGRLDEAVGLITTRQFFVAELAYHTRILYVRALLSRGARFFEESRWDEAAGDFRKATEYPPNIGAGRFHDSSDAQAFYLLGLALDRLSNHEGARSAWESAADDIPVRGTEQAFYVARARLRLGRDDAGEAVERIMPDEVEDDTPPARARREYLLGLSRLACGEHDEASRHLESAARVEAEDAVRLHAYLETLCYTRSEGRRVPIPVWWTVEPTPVEGVME